MDDAKFWPKFSLKGYFFYFTSSLLITPHPSEKLYCSPGVQGQQADFVLPANKKKPNYKKSDIN